MLWMNNAPTPRTPPRLPLRRDSTSPEAPQRVLLTGLKNSLDSSFCFWRDFL